MADILINNKDAQKTWGVYMGKGFMNSLLAPLGVKDYVENEVRTEHGTRYMIPTGAPFFSKRSLTLSFVIIGKSQADFFEKQSSFMQEMYKGIVNIQIPAWSNDTFKLHYTGQSCTWNMNTKRTIATITLKFDETNPKDR